MTETSAANFGGNNRPQSSPVTNVNPPSVSSAAATPLERPKGHLIASATSKVLIHKIDDSTPTSLINDPHQGFEISAMTWSHNNMIIATCGVNSCSITLARTSDGNVI